MFRVNVVYQGALSLAKDAEIVDLIAKYSGAQADAGYGYGERDVTGEFTEEEDAQLFAAEAETRGFTVGDIYEDEGDGSENWDEYNDNPDCLGDGGYLGEDDDE